MTQRPDSTRSGGRMTASERRRQGIKAAANPYATRSAAERRAEKRAERDRGETGTSAPGGNAPVRSAPGRHESAAARTAYLLDHPTREVTEGQLREVYGYVVNDLRSMFLLAGGLIVLIVVLAQVLPR